MLTLKDERFRVMNELISGMRILKLYGWELGFEDIINQIRVKEIQMIRRTQAAMVALIVEFKLAPFLMSVAAFYCYVLINPTHILTARTAFVGISVISDLGMAFALVPQIFSGVFQSLVSVGRMNSFLNSDEIDPYINREPDKLASSDLCLSIKNGYFAWVKSSAEEDQKTNLTAADGDQKKPIHKKRFVLRNINISVKKGHLLIIIGPVGSGKSTLLYALLGQLIKLNGEVTVIGKVAYVPQQAWILNASIRKNILFTKPFKNKKYEEVLKACALTYDLNVLPAGDETEIGEKGINLSGGQKQRISIARACYASADVYFFDDPLSAVDVHVGSHLFKHVIGHKGLLADRTRILVTHNVSYLPYADRVIVLKDGMVAEQGTYNELVRESQVFAELVNQLKAQQDKESPGQTRKKADENQDKVKNTDKFKQNAQLIEDEDMRLGAVDWHVYAAYLDAIGYKWPIMILFFSLMSVWFSIKARDWLSVWSGDVPGSDGKISETMRDYRILIYCVLGFGNAVALMLSLTARNYASIEAAALIHMNVLYCILRAPVSFFETTPTGRIVNRFSRDIAIVDVIAAETLHMWMFAVFQLCGTLLAITIEIPIFFAAAAPLSILYYGFQMLYLSLSRQLQRLISVTFSPIFSHFTETFAGISVIRAFEVKDFFVKESCRKLDASIQCSYADLAAERWLTVRLEICGSLILLFASLVMVYYHEQFQGHGEKVGLILTYSLSVTMMLNSIIRTNSQMEISLVSVERLLEYINLPSEAPWKTLQQDIPAEWPEHGGIAFENYSTRYREGLPLVLKSISIVINPGEKVGIVGRTGTGKSSLALALFRVLEAAKGRIVIDNIDIGLIGLHDLRHRLTIIPQDPVLFRGSLRLNLDPLRSFNDKELWRALELAHSKEFVGKLTASDGSKGLSYLVTEGGANLSMGQRQLLCLARALLRKSRILVMDEATAAVDQATDKLIQETIRKEFKHCTVLTIAHRLNTILDYDR
ncbi:canalicular multispecific organic anion transporter 1-like isoform X2 [Varroa destructor]|uniref:Multidrug resistance-associated protein 1 n=1 Tax=Varroa destructor TaxID=109461 RepID=A0A7M7MEE5_VARDE|nr:canalicular multispecific organic anion transporter 1-like isoform X2 [Varroa destructor]